MLLSVNEKYHPLGCSQRRYNPFMIFPEITDKSIVYKGKIGEYDWDPETNTFIGGMVNSTDVIWFQAENKEDLPQALAVAVEIYLNRFNPENVQPLGFSGKFKA